MITLDDALAHGRGIERPFNCINPEHADRNASASVNITNGYWYCFACSAKGTVEGHVPDPSNVVKMLEMVDAKPREYPEQWLDLFDADHVSPYWAERSGKDVAAAYRCGTDPLTGCPTYPIRSSSGMLWGVVKRVGGDRKYEYPYGVSISKTMFKSTATRRAAVVVLVEGASDVLAIAQSGIPRNWRVFGTYGAGLHAAQRVMLADHGPKVVIAAFDDDEAGLRASANAHATLKDSYPVLSHLWSKFGVKDAGELNVEWRVAALTQTLADSQYRRYGDTQ